MFILSQLWIIKFIIMDKQGAQNHIRRRPVTQPPLFVNTTNLIMKENETLKINELYFHTCRMGNGTMSDAVFFTHSAISYVKFGF